MKIQICLVIAAALMNSMALAGEPNVETNLDQTTGREIVTLSEHEGRSFFRPKTTEDIRELASENSTQDLKALDAIASHQDDDTQE